MRNLDVDPELNFAIMTPKQVAGYLLISQRTVYSNWEKLGGLKIGRTLRFRKEVIDALFLRKEKEMERGGEKGRQKVYASVSDKDGSEDLGSRKIERFGKPETTGDRNRHGLLDCFK
ncbi:MAG TPA: helix-turn-helix domain-containing protein [Paludibacter sp.]|nr:helix-turn-helix domain-containing protein [Paludibacter sp.]